MANLPQFVNGQRTFLNIETNKKVLFPCFIHWNYKLNKNWLKPLWIFYCKTGGSTIVEAISSGRKAAQEIIRLFEE